MLDHLAPLMSRCLSLQDAPGGASHTFAGSHLEAFSNNSDGNFLFVAAGCGFTVIFVGISIWIYIVLMQSMMKVPVEHRKMLPGLVWLNFIPCASLVWSFFLAIWIPQSIESALGPRAANTPTGRSAGMTWAVLTVVNACVSIVGVFIGLSLRMNKIRNDEPLTKLDFLPDLIGMPIGLLVCLFLILFGLQIQSAAKVLVEGDGSQAS